MSQRKAKRARQVARAAQPPARRKPTNGSKSRLWIYAAAVVVAAAVVGGVLAARGNGPAHAVPAARGAPLNLSGSDPVTGRHVSLAAFKGKPIVLNVWGSWCTGCREEARDLAAFTHSHPNEQTVGIDTQDTSGGARTFYREFGWHHPSIADPDGSIAASLGLQGTPTTFFLDRRHRVVTRIVGATNLAGFDAGLRAALHSS